MEEEIPFLTRTKSYRPHRTASVSSLRCRGHVHTPLLLLTAPQNFLFSPHSTTHIPTPSRLKSASSTNKTQTATVVIKAVTLPSVPHDHLTAVSMARFCPTKLCKPPGPNAPLWYSRTKATRSYGMRYELQRTAPYVRPRPLPSTFWLVNRKSFFHVVLHRMSHAKPAPLTS
jgi:hypothetical protein